MYSNLTSSFAHTNVLHLVPGSTGICFSCKISTNVMKITRCILYYIKRGAVLKSIVKNHEHIAMN